MSRQERDFYEEAKRDVSVRWYEKFSTIKYTVMGVGGSTCVYHGLVAHDRPI